MYGMLVEPKRFTFGTYTWPQTMKFAVSVQGRRERGVDDFFLAGKNDFVKELHGD